MAWAEATDNTPVAACLNEYGDLVVVNAAGAVFVGRTRSANRDGLQWFEETPVPRSHRASYLEGHTGAVGRDVPYIGLTADEEAQA